MRRRILVVDDDPALCELIQEILNSIEMESLTLTDSSQAEAHIAREKFSALFFDVRMPPPDGLELTRMVRASSLNRTTPIAIITGEEDRTVLGRAFGAGANFFLSKPVSRHRLLRLIRLTGDSVQREARRFQRVMVRCKVSIDCGQERLSGSTLDLSLTGMFVQVSHVLPLGSAVRVCLELKSGTPPLSVNARVVRVAGGDCMGLQINNAGSDENVKLQEFILPLILAKVD
jgi:DNA-binding response OmpR family regulator